MINRSGLWTWQGKIINIHFSIVGRYTFQGNAIFPASVFVSSSVTIASKLFKPFEDGNEGDNSNSDRFGVV